MRQNTIQRSSIATLFLGTILATTSCQNQTNTKSATIDINSRALRSQTKPQYYAISSSATLVTLVRHAEQHHPATLAAQAKIQRLLAKVPQVKALPDPKARIAAGSLAETAAGRTSTIIGIEQSIPYPGKRSARAAAAQKEAQAASAELDNIRLRIAEQVRFAYWDYYYASQSITIQRSNKQILKNIQDVIQTKVEANQANQSDILRISTQIAQTDKQIIIAKQKVVEAKSKLNSLLNRPVGSSLPAPHRGNIASNKSLSRLLTRAENIHPSIRANQSKVAAFQQRLKLAHLNKLPDFTIGAQYAPVSSSGLSPVANGRDQAMLTLGFTIPLWQEPRKAKIREANAGIAQMNAQLNLSRTELQQRIKDAHFQIKSTQSIIQLYQQRLIPDAKHALELDLDSYAAGKISYVSLLDTWRTLLTLQLQQQANYAQLGKASASLKSSANLN